MSDHLLLSVAQGALWLTAGGTIVGLIDHFLYRWLRRESQELFEAAKKIGIINGRLRADNARLARHCERLEAQLAPFKAKRARGDKDRFLKSVAA